MLFVGSGSSLYYVAELAASSPLGYLWNLQVKLQPIVNLLPDKGRLMDFLLQRKECKIVILSVCSQSKWTGPSHTVCALTTILLPICLLSAGTEDVYHHCPAYHHL